jgi:glycosyltransferase A (GT-A) superfamily protein (DUF2064 family)
LPPTHVAAAFERLDRAEAVFGPTDDGGYYLVGLTRPRPRLLREVRMSTPTVLRDTLALAQQDGVRTALLPPWYDVDTIADLHRLDAELRDGAADRAPYTRAFLLRQGVPSP